MFARGFDLLSVNTIGVGSETLSAFWRIETAAQVWKYYLKSEILEQSFTIAESFIIGLRIVESVTVVVNFSG